MVSPFPFLQSPGLMPAHGIPHLQKGEARSTKAVSLGGAWGKRWAKRWEKRIGNIGSVGSTWKNHGKV